ncbi:MAG: hypothetical protein RL220_1479 [Bacteroidota bacterium]
MRRLYLDGEGLVSIVHIGGSHVQAGYLTDRMRANFVSVAGGVMAERGFLFPYKLAGSNSPASVRCKWTGNWTGCRNALSTSNCDWGMSGITASTSDSTATVKLWAMRSDSTTYKFNMVRIMHPDHLPDGWSMKIDSVGSHHRHIRKYGYTEFHLSEYTDTLRISIARLDSSAGEFSLQGIYLGEQDRSEASGIVYNPIGVNGAGTYSYLRCKDFGKQLHAVTPDLVIFGIGVNDANVPESDFMPEVYEARYDSLIQTIRSVNPDCAFLFITNNDTYYNKRYPNRNAFKVRETMLRLAEKHHGAVYDLFNVMGGLGSISDWRDAKLASSDLVHLTREGYELQADMMFQAIRDALGDYMAEQGLE